MAFIYRLLTTSMLKEDDSDRLLQQCLATVLNLSNSQSFCERFRDMGVVTTCLELLTHPNIETVVWYAMSVVARVSLYEALQSMLRRSDLAGRVQNLLQATKNEHLQATSVIALANVYAEAEQGSAAEDIIAGQDVSGYLMVVLDACQNNNGDVGAHYVDVGCGVCPPGG
eukprot:gene25037-10684_t